jgi:hypothetical protein
MYICNLELSINLVNIKNNKTWSIINNKFKKIAIIILLLNNIFLLFFIVKEKNNPYIKDRNIDFI